MLNSQSVLKNYVTLYCLARWVWDLFGVEKYRLYSGYVSANKIIDCLIDWFNAISLIHVLRSDTFKAERIIGCFEHNSLERLAAASGCMSSNWKIRNDGPKTKKEPMLKWRRFPSPQTEILARRKWWRLRPNDGELAGMRWHNNDDRHMYYMKSRSQTVLMVLCNNSLEAWRNTQGWQIWVAGQTRHTVSCQPTL